nr:hypothetical protein [Vibrio sp. 03_296]
MASWFWANCSVIDVICMKGRGHYYEHQTMKVMTNPVRTFKRLGCEFLLVTNAAGSLRPERHRCGLLGGL